MNVYDTHNEVSFKGKITEVMGRNNYLVESEQGTKHVSGDVMTKISDIVNRPMGGSTQNFEDKEDLESIQSDVSDISEDFEDVISPLKADPYGTTFETYSMRVVSDIVGNKKLISLVNNRFLNHV